MNKSKMPEHSFLVVDDNPDDFFAVKRSLQQAGVKNPLLHCESGEEALEQLRAAAAARGLPALVLLDINMPGMKGAEVLAAIRADHATASLPVIMLTSSDDDRDVHAAFKGHASGYLNKPLETGALERTLERLRGVKVELLR
jgi:two-component system response regulator